MFFFLFFQFDLIQWLSSADIVTRATQADGPPAKKPRLDGEQMPYKLITVNMYSIYISIIYIYIFAYQTSWDVGYFSDDISHQG